MFTNEFKADLERINKSLSEWFEKKLETDGIVTQSDFGNKVDELLGYELYGPLSSDVFGWAKVSK